MRGIRAIGQSAENDPIFALDVLEKLSSRASTSTWLLSCYIHENDEFEYVDSNSEIVNRELDRLVEAGSKLSFREFCELLGPKTQLIWLVADAKEPGEIERWLRINFIDGYIWEFETQDEATLNVVRSAFSNVEDIP